MNESNGVLRDARKLGIPKMLILGLQHMFAMFGATILVPILVNTYFEGQGLSGKQLLCRRMRRGAVPRSYRIRHTVLRRLWNPAVPSVREI